MELLRPLLVGVRVGVGVRVRVRVRVGVGVGVRVRVRVSRSVATSLSLLATEKMTSSAEWKHQSGTPLSLCAASGGSSPV